MTKEQCEDMVVQKTPTANGVQWDPDDKRCIAEFGLAHIQTKSIPSYLPPFTCKLPEVRGAWRLRPCLSASICTRSF